MTGRQRRRQAIRLEAKIHRAQEELANLREACPHEETRTKVGENAFMVVGETVCIHCGDVLSTWCGGPDNPSCDRRFGSYGEYMAHEWTDWEED
jgi:hypothetical protein